MAKKVLVFVPTTGAGHMVSAVEFAKHLIEEDKQLAVTFLIIKPPYAPPPAAASQFNHPDIRFIQLPQVDPPPPEFATDSFEKCVSVLIESHKSHVKDAILEHVVSKSIPLAGIIVDMFCTSMIDVANEFGVPSYVFFTSAALTLGFLLYLPIHSSNTGREFFVPSDPDSIIPCFAEPLPSRFLPSFVFNEDSYSTLLTHVGKFKKANGIIINTFAELEGDTIKSLESQFGKKKTKIYTVGPLINQGEPRQQLNPESKKIISWLDEQPSSSVVFLCFGSKGGFQSAQLVEIAIALEKTGQRFLWSILQKPPSASREYYIDFSEVLPDGFLERTKNRGLVCGWAPQVDVLSHEAVGGFVSHCGWNSILESMWNGVPIAAWPLCAEQQLNAYKLVKELGLAVEVKLDYQIEDGGLIVPNDEIERAITSLMDDENPARKNAKEISFLSRQAILQGGSSFNSMANFVADI